MHTLLLVIVSFFSGVAIILSYKAIKFFKHNNSSLKNAIIESRIKQYGEKMHEYDKAIADLRVKIDMLEISEKSSPISRDVNVKKDTNRDIHMISQNSGVTMKPNENPMPNPMPMQANTYVDTLEQILLLLREKPMTTTQIQEMVRKTREHTSRIMNGLYHSGFVIRDTSSKPFMYSITDTGLLRLRDLHSDSNLNITTKTEQNLNRHRPG